MKWYHKFLSVYEKPYAEAAPEIVAEVRSNIEKLQSSEPLVTISVIGYNEERHLLGCLWSLSEQRCKYPLEIIGVDNNSKDRTAEIFEATAVRWFRESTPGCGHARLCGLNNARGKYHINIDADTMYPPHYVETMVETMIRHKLIGVSALWGFIPDKEHSAFGLWIYETMRDIHLYLQKFKRPEMSVRGMVFAYETEPARRLGIRTDIIRGEDGSLAANLIRKEGGRIGFLFGRRTRVVTGYGTMSQNGSLFDNFMLRIKKAALNFWKLFVSRRPSEMKDCEDNLLKKR